MEKENRPFRRPRMDDLAVMNSLKVSLGGHFDSCLYVSDSYLTPGVADRL